MWRKALQLDTVAVALVPLGCAALLVEASLRTAHRDADWSELCAYEDTNRVVTGEHVRELERRGFVCIPAAMDGAQVARARADAQALYSSGRFAASGNEAEVRQDHIATIRATDGTAGAAHAERGFATLGSGLLHAIQLTRGVSHALDMHGYAGLASRRVPRQVQLSAYAADGSASYRRHADACSDSFLDLGLLEWLRLRDYRERTLTAILYLNSPSWAEQGAAAPGSDAGSGGALRCFHAKGFTDIVPRGGTLVILDAKVIEHEVRPSAGATRFAITSWVISDSAT
ncbi:hypothetical protein KFE25_006001 [Diacronema lutheri]|uniref:Fe2OG dioxygenase domain-containing protein n=2 Tax=Diacronema lutheri TaxID=2081491 RepID=A0A8J5XV43_DIALT|nr:hypothetical protein KFE25_006001 [Diacronema lutheri]